MNIKRTLGRSIIAAGRSFKVILLTGPRQVGKTTLLQELEKGKRAYITLDDFNARLVAESDPATFIDRLKLPVLIDEVQYAPNLFPYIKMTVDKTRKNGLFWLTGSQQFGLMKNVTESLAGRVAVFHLQGISLSEEEGRPETPPFIPTVAGLKKRQTKARPIPVNGIYHKIWRGSYPDVVVHKGKTWERFYESYVSTYIERDVRDYLKVDDLMAFRKFMQVAAARTGQKLNYRNVAADVGVSEPTIKSWFNVLQASGLVVLIEPYFNNITKRLLKTPKFYFMDTGLCCFLTGWTNPDVLERGAMAGAMLETYVVSEIIKSYIHNGRTPRLYYYSDKEKREVDLMIYENGMLHPVEIKKSGSLQNMNFNGFDFLESLKTPIGHGCVLCFTSSVLPISGDVDAVPIGLI